MSHASKDVYLIILSRFFRMSAYGAVALILAVYLQSLDFSDPQIGLFMTLTLLGDVVVSLLLTLVADALGRRNSLLVGALGMALSGAVFASSDDYAALLAAANPRLTGITAIVNGSACRLCRPRSRNSNSTRCSGLSST